MTDLEKMLFIRAKVLEGKTKEQARQALSRQVRLDKLNNPVPLYRSHSCGLNTTGHSAS